MHDSRNVSTKQAGNPQGLHVVAKPIGPACNLDCEYCFYLEKQALFDAGGQTRMSDKVLSAFIAGYISSQPVPVVEFVWQGGEPTLLGIDFFKRVVELQKPFARGRDDCQLASDQRDASHRRVVPLSETPQLHGRDQPRRPEGDP